MGCCFPWQTISTTFAIGVLRYYKTCKYDFIIPKINSPWQGFTHICVGELGSHLLKWWLVIDYSTVPLHSLNGRQFPAIKTVQGDCQWPLKTVENSHQSHELIIHCDWDNPNLWFHQPITKEWCRSTRVYVSYPIDNPTATRLGLCSSLWHASSYVPSCHLINNILLSVWPLGTNYKLKYFYSRTYIWKWHLQNASHFV